MSLGIGFSFRLATSSQPWMSMGNVCTSDAGEQAMEFQTALATADSSPWAGLRLIRTTLRITCLQLQQSY